MVIKETVLTDEEIIMIGQQDRLIEAGVHGFILPIAFARAIERAVLQSQDRQVDALRKAVDNLVDFANTVAPSASFWDEVWPELEEAIEHARRFKGN